MIDILVSTLVQAALGEPQETPVTDAPAAVEAASPDATGADEQAARREARHRRRCRMEVVTGSRLPATTCSSNAQDQRWEAEARWQLQRIIPNPTQPE